MISHLQKQGFRVTRTGERRLMLQPSRRITQEVREYVNENLDALLSELPPYQPAKPKVQTTAKPVLRITGGVGTELKGIVPKWFKNSGCGCDDYARKLDQNGITWCDNNSEEIVAHLVEQASSTFMIALGRTFNKKGAGWCLSSAINRARTEEARQYGDHFARGPLITLPENSMVVTAGDDRFIAGVTLLAWTTLQYHKCRLRIYDLGISRNAMRLQLESWGAELVKPGEKSLAIPRGVPGWQIFNKPTYIDHALKEAEQLIWLDADACVSGDLSPLLAGGFRVPDHGGFDAYGNATRLPITKLVGPDVKKWSGTHYPCAGVIGLSRQEQPIVDEWLSRTHRIYDADRHQHAQYFDQSILQTFYAGPLIDGKVFNSFSCPRQGDQDRVFRHMVDCPDRVVNHFGGSRKPFLDWPEFKWPMPRGAR